ncbi:hypothetical protein [Actinoplanes sp. N902-109]|uniref:hypothetical protein n=1 Tax=Actinoplanes sp. (strain N902-109) TaxID=649831 RepID=UPI0003295E78|nr:hypothetical protein [Actinoplanes sp. N902-109]AGL17971.1 hypothetical protein L083_4461 [Actinoplanes sp. N902-109]
MSWTERYPLLCVTVVDGIGPDEAVRAIGGTDRPAGMTLGVSGRVFTETDGAEGVRPEVLQRLSARGRALSWARLGDGLLVLGYAEHGRVVAVAEPPRAGVVLDRLGVDPGALAGATGCHWGIALMHAAFGVAITERTVAEPDRVVPLVPIPSGRRPWRPAGPPTDATGLPLRRIGPVTPPPPPGR